MSTDIGFLLLLTAVAVGSFGWGSTIVRILFGHDDDKTVAWNLVPVRIAIGIAAFLAIGGYLVETDSGRIGYLLAWQFAGCVLALINGVRHRNLAGLRRPARGWLRLGAISTVALGLGYLAFGAAAAGPYNVYDDDAAYLYLAKRLLATGGLNDAFNMRRISSYGGAELFQAMSMWVAGPRSGLTFEWFFFLLLAVAIVVGTTTRRFVVAGMLVIGLGVLLTRPVGAWANVAPTFSGVALMLAVFRICASARRSARPAACLALCGLLLAGLLSLRLEFALPSAVVVVATAFSMLAWRDALRPIAIGASVAVLGTLGWAAALQSSSGTPLFPVIGGDWNEAFPWPDPAVKGLGAYLRRAIDEFGTSAAWVTLIGGAVAVVLASLFARRMGATDAVRPARIVLGAALIGTAVQIVAETPSLSGGTLTDIGRYDGPEVLACLLFAIGMLWDLAEFPLSGRTVTEVRSVVVGNAAATSRPDRYRLMTLGLAVAIFLLSLATWPDTYWTAFKSEVDQANDVVAETSYFFNPWVAEQPPYDALNALIPRGAHVLAAVDNPGLLDFSKFNFATLDIPGATSPPPGIPLLKGENAVYSYLVDHGFTAIVASSARLPGLYQLLPWKENETSGIHVYKIESTYFLAWYNDLQLLRVDKRCATKQLTGLVYIDLHRTSPPQGRPSSSVARPRSR